MLLYNGFETAEQRRDFDAVAAGTPHEKFETPAPVLDLEAYRTAIAAHPSRHYGFINSYAHVLADGWLELLHRHSAKSDVGIVGCTGSWESMGSGAPLIARPYRLRQFKPFPNPHIRSGSFMLSHDVLEQLDWFPVRKKIDAWKLENGRHSLSAQAQDLGLRLIVAGRDGVGYDWRDWPESATFRSHEQQNLLVADNRTDTWFEADAKERSDLARLAWGPAEE